MEEKVDDDGDSSVKREHSNGWHVGHGSYITVENDLVKFDHRSECFFRTGRRKQELNATFTCSSMRKLTLDVHHKT